MESITYSCLDYKQPMSVKEHPGDLLTNTTLYWIIDLPLHIGGQA